MGKKQANMKTCIEPTPKILVSCKGKNGEENALAVAYCCNCSYDPPMVMVGIVPSRYSYNMIKESECLVVNIASQKNKAMFDYLGSVSRRDENKLKVIQAKTKKAVKVDAPILCDCPVNIECKIVDSITTGSHEMFACTVEYIHADDDIVDSEGNIDFSGISLL